MAKIIYFHPDRQLAAPSETQGSPSGSIDPHNQLTTIKVTIKAVDENNQGVRLPLLIGSFDSAGSILYFNSDFEPIPVDSDSFIHVSTWAGGELYIYLCSTVDILFTLMARIDEPDQAYISLDLLFFNFGMPPGEGLPVPNLPRANGQLSIPPWSSFIYAANANTSLPPASYQTAAIVCNDYVRTGDPSMISNYFRVPYEAILTKGRENSLAYVLNTGANTVSSPVVRFTASGQGLVMPDPDKGAIYPAPARQGKTPTSLTTYDISPALVLEITLVEGVREGDTYDVNIYLNGYDPQGLFMPRAPVQVYTLTAPPGAMAGQKIPCRIDREHLVGYQRQSPTNWGYMWADCQITSAAWSYASAWTMPWGPVKIDFFKL